MLWNLDNKDNVVKVTVLMRGMFGGDWSEVCLHVIAWK